MTTRAGRRHQVHRAGGHRGQGCARRSPRTRDSRSTSCSNPEFLKEGAAVDDFMKPDRVVLGVESDHARSVMAELYAPFVRTGQADHLHGHPVRRDDEVRRQRDAGDAHLVHERDRRICASASAPTSTSCARASAAMRASGRRSSFPGPGYGGSCFPKDVKALVRTARAVRRAAAACSRRSRRRTTGRSTASSRSSQTRSAGRCRSAHRGLGSRVQAQHRRHARVAGADADRAAARSRRHASSRTIRPPWKKRSDDSATVIRFRRDELRRARRRRCAGRRDRLERVPAPGLRAHQGSAASPDRHRRPEPLSTRTSMRALGFTYRSLGRGAHEGPDHWRRRISRIEPRATASCATDTRWSGSTTSSPAIRTTSRT